MKSTINTIPLDLTFEILLRLLAKSVLRFKSVSKSWYSIIRSKEFIDAFMSLSRPRHVLLLNNRDEGRVLFFSSPHQSYSFLSSSSISFAKDNSLALPKFKFEIDCICNSVRGFLCCRIREGFVVCNPSTGQVVPLPNKNDDNNYLFFSRIFGIRSKERSVQSIVLITMSRRGHYLHIEHSVCTLRSHGSSHSWRSIKANISDYSCYSNGVCIDGVVYYKCWKIENQDKTMLSCFDVGSEQLRDIEIPEIYLSGDITNYLGKLAMYCSLDSGIFIWVLDDVKNQIWSKKTYEFPLLNDISMRWRFRFQGITASGELLYVPRVFSDSLEFLCYDMEKKMGKSIGVTGLSDYINCSTLKINRFNSSLLCSYVDNVFCL